MKELIHTYEGTTIRTVVEEKDNKVLVSVTDLARAMGMSGDRFTRLIYPSKNVVVTTGGGRQAVKMISREDAVSLLYRSKKMGIESLRDWFVRSVVQ